MITDESNAATQRLLIAMELFMVKNRHLKSMNDLCNMVGILPQAVSRWEPGKANPTLDNIIIICRVCGISPNHVILNMGDPFLTDQIHERKVTPVKKIRLKRASKKNALTRKRPKTKASKSR